MFLGLNCRLFVPLKLESESCTRRALPIKLQIVPRLRFLTSSRSRRRNPDGDVKVCSELHTHTEYVLKFLLLLLTVYETLYQLRYVEMLFLECYVRSSQDYLSYSDRILLWW